MPLRILREPLFHFFLLGAAIFGWFFWVNPPDPDGAGPNRIVVDSRDAERLSARFNSARQRLPTEAELQSMIDALVREEVLVREARLLGMDQGDGVVRNRLAQKMLFLVSSLAQSSAPDETVLSQFVSENREKFTTPAKVSFQQVILPPDADPANALDALNDGHVPDKVGVPTMLPDMMQLSPATVVDGTFGSGFFEQILHTPVGVWSGPISSGFGQHLVNVMEVRDAELPPLDAHRDKVLLEWRKDQTARLTEEQVDRMIAQYEITTPDPTDLSGFTAQ